MDALLSVNSRRKIDETDSAQTSRAAAPLHTMPHSLYGHEAAPHRWFRTMTRPDCCSIPKPTLLRRRLHSLSSKPQIFLSSSSSGYCQDTVQLLSSSWRTGKKIHHLQEYELTTPCAFDNNALTRGCETPRHVLQVWNVDSILARSNNIKAKKKPQKFIRNYKRSVWSR